MSGTKPSNLKEIDKTEKDDEKSVAPLEEDDEFEDFPVESEFIVSMSVLTLKIGQTPSRSRSIQSRQEQRPHNHCGLKTGKMRLAKRTLRIS
jgi:hypothetical protein